MRIKEALVITVVAVLVSVPAARSFASSPQDLMVIDTDLLHSMVVVNSKRMDAGEKMKFIIIDARPLEDYKEAHVSGAISIPEKDFEKSLGLLPNDKAALIVVYCNDRKCIQSRKWAAKASAAGYLNIVIYSDGFPYWRDKHMPVT
ncbi:MAG TPA: rhodanese-like domain-containing protein, partial [Nitrospirota bacterium]|nr:rhodanese-like domain-containing protein [Nitrospirota bacterium]